MSGFEFIETRGKPIKAWIKGVPVEDAARRQLENIAALPFIHKHVAAMPDVHLGRGATVGSVIATKGAIIPAAVGVDIGCGMMAVQTDLTAEQLPDAWPSSAPRSSARCRRPARPATGGTAGPGESPRPPSRAPAWPSACRRSSDKHPKIVRRTTASPAGHPGRRQPLHRGLPGRGGRSG